MNDHELKLGLIPNDPSRPRLHLADYVDPSQIVAPATSAYLNGLAFPIWLNATLGCCVAATLGLLILVWSTLLTGVSVIVSDAQILSWYQTQNPGADPKHPGVHDNGMNIQTFLEWLRGKKLPDGSTILGFADIDPRNLALVRKAIAIGGAIWTAGDITEANRAQWSAGRPFDYVAGSALDGGHSFVVGGEDASPPDDLQIGTWARVRRASDGYLANEIGEMWFVITDKMLGSKRFVAGMDLATFAADFQALTGDAFPAPVPAPAPTPPPPSRSAMSTRQTSISPVRAYDSRQHGTIAVHAPQTISLAGLVPADTVSVTGNLTVTGQTGSGYLAIGPDPVIQPTFSRLNFPKGDDRANSFQSLLGPGQTLSVTYIADPGASTHFIVDIDGFSQP